MSKQSSDHDAYLIFENDMKVRYLRVFKVQKIQMITFLG